MITWQLHWGPSQVQNRFSQHGFAAEQDWPALAHWETTSHEPASPEPEPTQERPVQQSESAVQTAPVGTQAPGVGHTPFEQLRSEQQVFVLLQGWPFGTQGGGGGGGGSPASGVPASTTVRIWQKAPNSLVMHWPVQHGLPPSAPPPGEQALPSGMHALTVQRRRPS